MFTKIFVTFVALVVVTNTCMAMPAFLEPAKIIQNIKKEIAKVKIDKDFTIFDNTMIDGIGQGVKYRFESEPSYVDQFYTRIDQYSVNVNANVGTLIGLDLAPLGFSLSKGSEITFARQFKSQVDSILAFPYTPVQLPFSVERMKKLKNGDFVGFTTTLNMIASIGAVLPANMINLSLGGYALIQGQFMVHIFKMNENNFRVKIIAIKTQNRGLRAGISIFNNSILNKAKQIAIVGGRIASVVDITPLVFGIEKGKSNLVMFDYVFNSNDPRSIKAYDHFSIEKVMFKDTTLANPFKDFERVDDCIMTDLTEVEAIALEDVNKPAKERAIERIFYGENNSSSKSSNFKIKLQVVNYSKDTTYIQNKIQSTDKLNNKTHFLFDSLSSTSKSGLLFGFLGLENNMYSNLLFKANEKFEPTEFADLIFSREIKAKQFSEKQYNKIKAHVKHVLPEAIYNKIVWKDIDFSNGSKVNGFFKNQITFTLASLVAAPELSKDEIFAILKMLGKDIARPALGPTKAYGDESNFSSRDWTDDYQIDLENLAIKISSILNKSKNPVERYSAFMSIKDSVIWREVAVKFFMTILPEEALENTVRYELILEAKGVEALRFKYGNAIEGELYKNLMYIQSIISNRSFDLRLYTDDNGKFTEK